MNQRGLVPFGVLASIAFLVVSVAGISSAVVLQRDTLNLRGKAAFVPGEPGTPSPTRTPSPTQRPVTPTPVPTPGTGGDGGGATVDCCINPGSSQYQTKTRNISECTSAGGRSGQCYRASCYNLNTECDPVVLYNTNSCSPSPPYYSTFDSCPKTVGQVLNHCYRLDPFAGCVETEEVYTSCDANAGLYNTQSECPQISKECFYYDSNLNLNSCASRVLHFDSNPPVCTDYDGYYSTNLDCMLAQGGLDNCHIYQTDIGVCLPVTATECLNYNKRYVGDDPGEVFDNCVLDNNLGSCVQYSPFSNTCSPVTNPRSIMSKAACTSGPRGRYFVEGVAPLSINTAMSSCELEANQRSLCFYRPQGSRSCQQGSRIVYDIQSAYITEDDCRVYPDWYWGEDAQERCEEGRVIRVNPGSGEDLGKGTIPTEEPVPTSVPRRSRFERWFGRWFGGGGTVVEPTQAPAPSIEPSQAPEPPNPESEQQSILNRFRNIFRRWRR